MKKRHHLLAWANHAALNAGAAIQCVFHIVLPPQVDHQPYVVRDLAESNPAKEFLVGAGVVKRRVR